MARHGPIFNRSRSLTDRDGILHMSPSIAIRINRSGATHRALRSKMAEQLFLEHAARLGELLPGRHRQQGVSGTRQLRSDAVAPVVAVQAQNQASQGRDLSTPASLRALWARTPEKAWARREVGEGVKFCPRVGCGVCCRSTRKGVCNEQLTVGKSY